MREICAECKTVLVVEDEGTLRIPLHDYMESKGASVTSVPTGTEGIAELLRHDYDVVFTDIRLPGADGFEVLRRALEVSSRTSVVMMTAYGDIEQAVRAMKMGAFDYLPKPFSFSQVDAVLLRGCRTKQLASERDELRAEVERTEEHRELVACSKRMKAVLDTVVRVAASDSSVVLSGETGTGKELIAEAIHRLSPRHAHRLVKLNCAAVPDTLIESEMFGHERGAFTGAVARKRGKFEMAHQGTIFLDEVADLSPAGQAKLLRAIQERSFERVGGVETIRVDVRFVAATHRNLKSLVREGQFREDLYYRLSVITIDVPPLRERTSDVEPLVAQLLHRAAQQVRKPVVKVSPRVIEGLRGYAFPGNVRELANLIERAATLCDGDTLERHHFPPEVVGAARLVRTDSAGAPFLPLAEARAQFESDYIAAALRRTGSRRGEAADLLGVSRKTLWLRLHGESLGEGGGESDGEDEARDG